jgi:hypothetical protein
MPPVLGGTCYKLLINQSLSDPAGNRTPNPQIRNLMLYPVELPDRGAKRAVIVNRYPLIVVQPNFRVHTSLRHSEFDIGHSTFTHTQTHAHD